MEACGIAGRVVESQGQVVKAHHLMKPVGQLMEKGAQIPVGHNRFRNRQQQAVLLIRGRRLVLSLKVFHNSNPSP